MNRTMASNHLSQAANKGRYGDDVLVHMSKNEVKTLANIAGLDDLPRNPETGLPEAWIFAVAQAGLSLYQGIKGSEKQREAGKTQLRLIQSQLKENDNAKDSLKTAVGGMKQTATADFERGLEQASSSTGQAKEDILEGYDKTLQASGLVTSGGAEESKEKMWKNVMQTFSTAQDNLYVDLSKKMGEAEGFLESETKRLESERKALLAARKNAQSQSTTRFLGFF